MVGPLIGGRNEVGVEQVSADEQVKAVLRTGKQKLEIKFKKNYVKKVF